MAVIVPFNNRWEGYVYQQSGATSWAGSWLDYRKVKVMLCNVSWLAGAGITGTTYLALEGTEDSSTNPLNVVELTPTTVDGATVAATTQITVGVAAGKALIVRENPPSFIRLKFVLGSGAGVANQFNAFAHGRSI